MNKSKHGVEKPKHRCLWGRKTEAQVLLGSETRSTGELWGRLGVALGDPGETLGGQRVVGGGTRRPKKKFLFLGFKIMKLCQNLNLLLKRLEID